jgi:hypothetical protein
MEDRCAFLEEEIPRIEAAVVHTEQQLAVCVSAAETQRLPDLAADLRTQLSTLTSEWEDLMLQLDGHATLEQPWRSLNRIRCSLTQLPNCFVACVRRRDCTDQSVR